MWWKRMECPGTMEHDLEGSEGQRREYHLQKGEEGLVLWSEPDRAS